MKNTKRYGKYLGRIGLHAAIIAGLLAGCSTGLVSRLGSPELTGASSDEAMNDRITSFMSHVKPVRGNPDSHYRLGAHYQARGRHEEAIEEFSKALAIDPRHIFSYNGLGISCDNLGQTEKARRAYREALRIAPEDFHAYNNLGYSYILEGDYKSAVGILLEGMSVDYKNKYMRNNIAIAYTALGEKQLAAMQLEEISESGKTESTLDAIKDHLASLSSQRMGTGPASASGSISSEDMGRVPARNRFVARMQRLINSVRKASATGSKSIPVDLVVTRLDHDFMRVRLNKDDDGTMGIIEAKDEDEATRYVWYSMSKWVKDEAELDDLVVGRVSWFVSGIL